MLAGLRHVWQVTRAAWAEDKARLKRDLRRQELAFLPAAVEVVETPASPVGRGVALTLMAVVVGALIWAWFGHVDTVAVAQGRIIPGGKVKTIQPLESAVVASIHVQEGQSVQAGDLLLTFDPTEQQADKGQVERELTEALLETCRLEATLEALKELGAKADDRKASADELFDQAMDGNAWLALDDPALLPLIRTQRSRMREDLISSRARLVAYDKKIDQQLAGQKAVYADIRRFEQVVPLLATREADLAGLLEGGMTERWRWLEVHQELIESREQLEASRHRLREAAAAIESLAEERQEAEANHHQQLLADLAAARTQADLSRLALQKAEQWERRQYLKAPVDGIVQQLQVHTIGGVVTPAEPLMIIVPKDAPLEIEAMALNKDIGFIQTGQLAEIKIEAFPFTRYGLIDGEIIQVSADAVADEQLGLVYPLKASMAQTDILVDDRHVNLAPGMTVGVEIKTGQRRLIEFFLSPFLQYQDEALRER
ncbi:MAG: HlyD family type I secretion periplasmic adaptor subunit [Geminicoccaceae bacterium]